MKFLIYFLGCKVNSYEADAVANMLEHNGYFLCKENEEPDVIIINTCSVTNISGSKSRKAARHLREKYKKAIIVVMGCESQNEGEDFNKELGADIVIGTSHRKEIINLINQFKKTKQPIYLHDEFNKIKKYESLNLTHFIYTTRAYVKIQDGCDNFCSYCLIPFLRGRSRSRLEYEILDEIKCLVKNGYKEIVLTGIDMCSYGQDFKNTMTFSDLLEDILTSVPDLYRLRISSIEESQIDDKFITLLKKYPNIADHLHIPLQSGSVEILKKMHRKYNLESFVKKIEKIREVRPNIAISTDVICGFPTETEEESLETYEFCKKIKFTKIHCFPYSIRKGTVAARMKPQIPMVTKKERTNKLIALSDELGKEYESQFKGKEIEFLIENYDEETKSYKGHSSNFLECHVKSDKNITDTIIKIIY